MSLDRQVFIENYLDELKENIENIDTQILALKKDSGNQESLTILLRALHTIKGSSRMLKFNTVEKIVHGLENVFKGVKDGRYGINRQLIRLVFVTTDTLRNSAERIKTEKDDSLPIESLLKVYDQAYANEPYSLDAFQIQSEVRSEMDEPGQTKKGPAGLLSAALALSKKKNLPSAIERKTPEVAIPTGVSSNEPQTETIRIKVSKVDGIVKLLNNLIIKQFQLKKENDVLDELEQGFRAILASQNALLLRAQVSEDQGFSKLESEYLKTLLSIKKRFSEELMLLERTTFEVQEEILSLRMLPLALIMGSLPKMVEETSSSLGKDVQMSIQGSDLLLDKVVLEHLQDPVLHIIRNALDHGIEFPEEREKAGKSKTGNLVVRCTMESGSVVIRIKDDGRGLDYSVIRQKAMEANPNQEEEIRLMDDEGLNTFLFMPGFSTSSEVTELSGRGIGLDIVRYHMEQVKGKVTLSSKTGQGTEFVLALPLSLATVDGFFVRSGGEKFLLPSSHVKEILIIEEKDKLDLLNRKAVKIRDKIVPIYSLADLLNKKTQTNKSKLYVVVVESMGERVGILVDLVVQYASLIYKPLPKNLLSLKVIQGIVFDESFNIINILYVPELIKRFKYSRNIDQKAKFSLDKREYKNILVVDDSFSTREIEKSILELENYNVETAEDGVDALEKWKQKTYHLVITDIHMPKMDGITLIENLRREDKGAKIPILVVTSDKEVDVHNRLTLAGADGFLDKADFDRGNLVSEVKRYIG